MRGISACGYLKRQLWPLLVLFVVLWVEASSEAAEKKRLGVGTSFSLGASLPKGDMWGVTPRANVGFALSVGLRLLFGHSCTKPTLFFIPAVVDTEMEGGRNGSLLSVLLGFQVYPHSIYFVQPYFMFAGGYGHVKYEGPAPLSEFGVQTGTGKGASLMVGGGVDFNLYKWLVLGPSFFWNPLWWFDCSIDNEATLGADICDPREDRWRLSYWFVGLRVSANFDW